LTDAKRSGEQQTAQKGYESERAGRSWKPPRVAAGLTASCPIVACGTVRTWANLLGKSDIAALLEDTLEEEKEADQKLTSIAESFVNEAAAEANEAAADEEKAGASSTRRGRHVAADRGSRGTVAAPGAPGRDNQAGNRSGWEDVRSFHPETGMTRPSPARPFWLPRALHR
jgi:hypothetical protein